MKKIEIVTYNLPKELHELANEMEMGFSSFEVTDRRIDILQRASDHLYKLDEENKRLREALESAQEELFTIRGVNKTHDGEITGLCIKIRKVLDGEEWE